MPEHHKIIIQAAVEAILGARARVLRIVPSEGQVSSWTRQGRLAIQGSHSLSLRTVRFLSDPGGLRR